MKEVLPLDLQARIGELSVGQIVAMRFASDAELPALVQRTLNDKWDQKQIKNAVQDWRADHFRV